ncbi:MAG: hypothetical protein FJ138_13890 [Deltaproteobacteria bacterium]|nr:hypothetical protein [Deltaproteobacteria bacterium]
MTPPLPARLALAALGALWLAACDGNAPPRLLPLQEQSWRVNAAQSLEVFAADADGDTLTFSFSLTPTPAARESAAGAPTLTPLTAASALFQWAPLSSDAGRYTLTLQARDPSGARAEESVSLTVSEGGGGGATQLLFERPQGTGVNVDVDPAGAPACLRDLEVLVKADAVPDEEVFVRLEAPAPAGVTLAPPPEVAGKRRALTWCPSAADLVAQGRFVLSLYAYRAGDEARGVRKQLLVRFARPNGAGCPGRPPSIEHTPADEVTGVADYVLRADVLDDLGVKSPPLLAYLVSPAADPRVELVEGWELVEFEPDPDAPAPDPAALVARSSWRAALPNPNLPDGAPPPSTTASSPPTTTTPAAPSATRPPRVPSTSPRRSAAGRGGGCRCAPPARTAGSAAAPMTCASRTRRAPSAAPPATPPPAPAAPRSPPAPPSPPATTSAFTSASPSAAPARGAASPTPLRPPTSRPPPSSRGATPTSPSVTSRWTSTGSP